MCRMHGMFEGERDDAHARGHGKKGGKFFHGIHEEGEDLSENLGKSFKKLTGI